MSQRISLYIQYYQQMHILYTFEYLIHCNGILLDLFLIISYFQVLLGVLCPNYLDLYEKYSNSTRMKSKYRTYQQTFDYISRNSGLNVRRFQDIYQLYFGISTESEYGLNLPSWLNSVWPDTIIKLSIEEYFVSMGKSAFEKEFSYVDQRFCGLLF